MKSALLLEDDHLFAESLIDFLDEKGVLVTHAATGEKALEHCYHTRFGFYLLDVRLPGMNGFDFLGSLRESGDETPALFLTSLPDKESLSTGYRVGADDFMRKPIDLDELWFRIEAILRRTYGLQESIRIGEWGFHPELSTLQRKEESHSLPPKTAQLLLLFLHNRNRLVSKELIFQELWDGVANDGALRVHIAGLKKLLGERIENIRGSGYRLKTE